MSGKIVIHIKNDSDCKVFLKCPICKTEFIFPEISNSSDFKSLIPYNKNAIDKLKQKPNVTIGRNTITCDKCKYTSQYIDHREHSRNIQGHMKNMNSEIDSNTILMIEGE